VIGLIRQAGHTAIAGTIRKIRYKPALILAILGLQTPSWPAQKTLRDTLENLGRVLHSGLKASATSMWGASRFPDSWIDAISCCELPVQVLVMGFLRSPVVERWMKTSPIVPELDVPCNIFSCLSSRRVNSTVNALNFHVGIEWLGQGIVKAAACPADGLADPEAFQDPGELARSVIAAMPLS